MRTCYRTNMLARAESLSTANRIAAVGRVDPIAPPTSEIISFSAYRRKSETVSECIAKRITAPARCMIVFTPRHVHFTLRNVIIIIPIFRALAVPYLSENFVMSHSWNGSEEAARSRRFTQQGYSRWQRGRLLMLARWRA